MPDPYATRQSNAEARAKRSTMVGNPSAQQAVRNTYSKKNPNPKQRAQMPVQNPMQGAQAPVGQFSGGQGGPQGQPEQEENSTLDMLVGELRFQHFLESPRTKDAMESVKLKELFNRFNENKRPDPRPFLERVMGRIGVPDE